MAKTKRPPGVEWGDSSALMQLVHGAPLLRGGVLQASSRDATFLSRPDVYTDKASHVVVVSHRMAVGSGMTCEAAACDPTRIMIDDGLVSDAVEVHPNGRCRRSGCRQLFALAEAQAASTDV